VDYRKECGVLIIKKKAWDEDEIRDKHSHEVEIDYIEWEAIEQEKSRWLSVLRKMRGGYE